MLVAKDEHSVARVLNTLEEVGKPSGLELSKGEDKDPESERPTHYREDR